MIPTTHGHTVDKQATILLYEMHKHTLIHRLAALHTSIPPSARNRVDKMVYDGEEEHQH